MFSQGNFKNSCVFLRKKNFTLGEISKMLGRPKTTVYFHIKDIPKSAILVNKIRQQNIKRIAQFRPTKGRSLLKRKIKNFIGWNSKLVSLCAHIAFDGAITKSGIVYHNRNEALIGEVQNHMELIYEFIPKFYRNGDGTARIAYHNVELAPFFRQKIKQLFYEIKSLSSECQISFLRAFCDDEGSVYFQANRNKRRIKGSQYKNRVLVLVKCLLKNFGISSTVDRKFHEIIIGKRVNLIRFAERINFSAGVCVNALRANSIWKRPIEKRQILAMALASYRQS